MPCSDEPEGLRADPDWIALGEVERETGQYRQRGEGGDEGRHVDLGDQQSVDQSGARARSEPGEQTPDQTGVREHHRSDDRGEAKHRSDGQVDLTENDHERLADREQSRDGCCQGDGHEVGRCEEERRGNDEDEGHAQEHPHGAKLQGKG